MLWLCAMTSNDTFEGGCTCRQIRYRVTSKPMYVHCHAAGAGETGRLRSTP